MVTILSLWLPILISAVMVFLASWIVHSMLPIHKGDFAKLANEDAVSEAMRKAGVTPGDYAIPYARSMKDLASPEMQEKFKRGPIGFMTIAPSGVPAMGASLTQWFVYCLVVGVVVAYVTSRTLAPDAHYLAVFRIAGVVSFAIYAGAHPSLSIWYKRKWSTSWKFVFDGLLYALLTAGTFGWLWPR